MKSESYLDLINRLLEEVEKDAIPKEEKEKIKDSIHAAGNLLWKYSY